MYTEKVGNASSASIFCCNFILYITMTDTMADPNMHNPTNNAYEDNGVIIPMEMSYTMRSQVSVFTVPAGGGKSSIDEPLKRFCALPF